MLSRLKEAIGARQVLTGTDADPWRSDWSGQYSAAPLAVLRPGSTPEVAEILRIANDEGCAVVPAGGGTGLVGGLSNRGALMISLDRMRAIREIRPGARLAVVEAGAVLSSVHEAAEAEGMIFPLFFGARGSATIGGCLSTNAGGSNVLRYGNTRDLCLGLEVVLPSGEVADLMSALHKNNSGYDLRHLMIGAEGTLGIITAAVLKLHAAPRIRATAMLAAASLPAALEVLNRLQDASGGAVEAFEYMPARYIEAHLAHFPDARAPFEAPHEINILAELSSTRDEDAATGTEGQPRLAALLERELARAFECGELRDAVIAQSEAQRREMWDRREQAAEVALARRPVASNDVALPLDRVAEFLARVDVRLAQLDPGAQAINVAHLGDGNVHCAVWPGDPDPAHVDRIVEAIDEVAAELGGTFSAEHGIGLSKRASMARYKDAGALSAMRAIKSALDPNNIMNPGKILPDAS